MTQKKPMGLGEDPLDALLTTAQPSRCQALAQSPKPTPEERPKPVPKAAKAAPKREGKPQELALEPVGLGPKVTVTMHLSSKVIERVRDAAYYVPGLTVSGITESALAKELDRVTAEYEQTYHQSIPKRTGQLRPGRPPKS